MTILKTICSIIINSISLHIHKSFFATVYFCFFCLITYKTKLTFSNVTCFQFSFVFFFSNITHTLVVLPCTINHPEIHNGKLFCLQQQLLFFYFWLKLGLRLYFHLKRDKTKDGSESVSGSGGTDTTASESPIWKRYQFPWWHHEELFSFNCDFRGHFLNMEAGRRSKWRTCLIPAPFIYPLRAHCNVHLAWHLWINEDHNLLLYQWLFLALHPVRPVATWSI